MKEKSFDEYLSTRLNVTEIKEIEAAAKLEAESLKTLQQDVSQAMATFMKEHNLGFNDIVRKLGKSPAQISRIIKGEANLTLTSVAQIYAMMRSKPRIYTEDNKTRE